LGNSVIFHKEHHLFQEDIFCRIKYPFIFIFGENSFLEETKNFVPSDKFLSVALGQAVPYKIPHATMTRFQIDILVKFLAFPSNCISEDASQ